MYMEDNFENWYENISNKFKEELIKLEEIVKEEKENNRYKFNISIVIFLITTMMLIVAGAVFDIMNIAGVIILLGILFALPILSILTLCNYKESSKQRIAIKKAIINIMIKSFENDIEYYPEEGISTEIYDNVNVEQYNYYYSNHLMSLKINNNHELQMAETQSWYERSNSKGERKITNHFKGTFANLNTPKSFSEMIYIKRGILNGLVHDEKNLPDKVMAVELDSQEFEEKFDVYASNKIIAMQLLTSDVMILLNDFYKYMQREFEIIIKNDNIYIKILNGVTFSNSLIKDNELDKELIYKNYRTINFILNISSKLVELINETPYL